MLKLFLLYITKNNKVCMVHYFRKYEFNTSSAKLYNVAISNHFDLLIMYNLTS